MEGLFIHTCGGLAALKGPISSNKEFTGTRIYPDVEKSPVLSLPYLSGELEMAIFAASNAGISLKDYSINTESGVNVKQKR